MQLEALRGAVMPGASRRVREGCSLVRRLRIDQGDTRPRTWRPSLSGSGWIERRLQSVAGECDPPWTHRPCCLHSRNRSYESIPRAISNLALHPGCADAHGRSGAACPAAHQWREITEEMFIVLVRSRPGQTKHYASQMPAPTIFAPQSMYESSSTKWDWPR